MTFKTQLKASAPSLRGLMADMARWGVVFDQEGIAPGEGDPPADPPADPPVDKDKPGDKPAAKPKTKTGPSEIEAALQAKVAELEGKLGSFGDATPEELAQLRKMRADAEKAAEAAEKKRREEEKARLEAEGRWKDLQEQMAREHEEETAKLRAKIDELTGVVQATQNQVIQLNVGTAFASSAFVSNETVLTPSKAKRIYEDHFDVADGRMTGFDQPRGTPGRKPLVDAAGRPLPFDEALRRIIEADPDRDSILRSKAKPGSGVVDGGAKAPAPAAPIPTGVQRIAAGLASLVRAS